MKALDPHAGLLDSVCHGFLCPCLLVVEERRTVRDSQGNEETTVTRTRADQRDGEREGASAQFTDSCLRDDFSVFSKIFRGCFTGR
ncbi:UNVERIFIED_CONTAM: hypothetical protein FKN15_014039 [Acipenser sinensis]